MLKKFISSYESSYHFLFKYLFFLLILLFQFSSLCYGATLHKYSNTQKNLQYKGERKNVLSKTSKDEEPPKLGNFSLPSSQQPGSLIGFGENIFDKGTYQLNMGGDYYKYTAKHSTDVFPNIIYALSDTSSILLSTPYAAEYKETEVRSSGFEDMYVQFEHAFYVNKNSCLIDQVTVVMNASLPTGSASKQPPTGYGAPTYFLGNTFLRTYVDWFLYTSHGVLVTSSHHGTKFGNQFLYQYGVGRNIAFVKDQWIFDWLVELTGQYTGKDKIKSKIDPNSGGNVVLLTPSIWISTKRIILQFGISKPVVQRLFGIQSKNHFVLFGNFAWTF